MNPFNLDPLPPRSPAAGPSSPEPLERRERFDRSAFQRDFCQRSEAVAGRWRALLVGNSRWHWATFRRDRLIDTWDGEPWHGELEATSSNAGPIAAASVVPAVTGQLQILAQGGAAIYPIPLAAIPLHDLYGSLGIDRAIALWGAGRVHGFPVLVIDAGTALTLSAADGDRHFLGGAILPGFGLQLRALAEGTAALPPLTVPRSGVDELPPRFATDTATAILSGVGYGLAAVLRDRVAEWRSRFPTGAVVLTGGDGAALRQFLRAGEELPGPAIALDPHLWRWGLRELVYPEPPRP